MQHPPYEEGDEGDGGGGGDSPPPPLPPRASKILLEHQMENSPPLPPRNPNLAVNQLDTVVPISPRPSPGDR